VLPYEDALFLIVDVGGVMFVDTSFDPDKVDPEYRGLPNRKDNEGYALTVLFFDTAKDMTMALRMATVTPAFSQRLEGYIEDLYRRLESDPKFDAEKSIYEAYTKYERPDQMMDACIAVETLGMPFPKTEEAS
jgi:hypothetical protein